MMEAQAIAAPHWLAVTSFLYLNELNRIRRL
jgi:hypothetical protein